MPRDRTIHDSTPTFDARIDDGELPIGRRLARPNAVLSNEKADLMGDVAVIGNAG
jgi:hypothetical protein